MGAFPYLLLILLGWLSLVFAEDLLFPYMHGLNYSEYDQAIKLGLTAHVCKDEAEWYAMTTADFAKYKAIVIPDCQCNTSLNTIKFLDETKRVWSPAVTGNMVIIGTDPSFHHKWFKLPGADAMMNDSIRLVSTGENGTGMYMSLSCYYQSAATPVAIEALSEIGNFQVRGNLSHPCLNNAHLVAKADVMTSLTDEIASNWNCSVHEAFSEFPTTGSRGFQTLAIALNATGPGQRSFGDGTSGIPYIIARGATPVGCGNNITETEYGEDCDNGPANGTPGNLCSSSCQCVLGMITPGVCRSNTTSSSTSSTQSSTLFMNSSSISTSTPLQTNSSSTRSFTTITAWPSNYTNTTTSRRSTTGPATITVFPPPPPKTSATGLPDISTSGLSSSSHVSKDSVLPTPPAKTVTVEPPVPSGSSSGVDPKPSVLSSSTDSGHRTVTVQPPSATRSAPGTVTVWPPTPRESGPNTITVQPPEPSVSKSPTTSPGSHGDVTVTVSGQPASQSPKASTSSTNQSRVSTPDGNITITGPGFPDTQPPTTMPNSEQSSRTPTDPGDITVTATGQPQSRLPASSFSTSPSSSVSSNGGVTVTASEGPGTELRRPSTSVSLQTTTTGPGEVTVTASGEPSTTPDQPGPRTSRETTSASETWSSKGFGNHSSSSSGRPNAPQSTIIVTTRSSDNPGVSGRTKSRTSPAVVTVSGPRGPPGQSGSQTETPGHLSTGPWPTDSQRSTDLTQSPTPGETGSSKQSGQPVSVTSSRTATHSSKSANASLSQSNEPVVTVTASPSRLGTSSGRETATTSYKPSRSRTQNESTSISSLSQSSAAIGLSDTLNRQTSTSQSVTRTQQISRDPVHTDTNSDSPRAGSTHTMSSTAGATSAGEPISQAISSSSMLDPSHTRNGTATSKPSRRTSSHNPFITNNPQTPAPGKPSDSSQFSSSTASRVSTNIPIGTTAKISSSSVSHLPGTSSDSSRTLTRTSTRELAGTSGTVDLTGLPISQSSSYAVHGGTSHPKATDTPFKTLPSTSRSRINTLSTSSSIPWPTFHTYSRGLHTPVLNSSLSGTVTTTFGTETGRYNTPSSISSTAGSSPNHCDTWIGVEIIHMIEVTERCPEGSIVTQTVTEIVATMTRSICETSATNLPCYPCVLGTPSSSHDRATVTVTSCSTLIEPTVTVTVQLCSTCTKTTYTGTVPGYTPGAPCHACSSYGPGPISTAAIPPPIAASTTSRLPVATPIPLISESIGNTPPPPPPPPPKASIRTTSIPPLPDHHPSAAPPEGKPSSVVHGGTTVRSPGESPDPGVIPSSTRPPPPAKGTSSTDGPDNNTPYGYPTTTAISYSPPFVTAGAVRKTLGYPEVLGGLCGLHMMYYIVFVWL